MGEEEKNSSSIFDWGKKTIQYYTGVGLAPDDLLKYKQEQAIRKTESDCKRCYEYRDWMLKYSPSVTFMIQQIEKVKPGDFDTAKIICEECVGTEKAGGFHPEKKDILLCQNHILHKYHLEDILSHELVHYYDSVKFKVDWLNLKHHACTEIRASSLSGECRMMLQFWYNAVGKFADEEQKELLKVRTMTHFAKGHQECVRNRAIASVMGNPNCKSKEHAGKVVDEVFESCFNDTRPFEQIYR